MKKIIWICVLMMPVILVAQDSLKAELGKFLDSWHQAAADADLELYFSFLDESSIFIGTDSSEHWTKDEFYSFSKPYFNKGKAWTFKASSRNIYISDNLNYAWFDELLYTGSTTWRGSGILVKSNGKWVIKHYTLSVTLPNNKMKEFIELLKK